MLFYQKVQPVLLWLCGLAALLTLDIPGSPETSHKKRWEPWEVPGRGVQRKSAESIESKLLAMSNIHSGEL